MTPFSLKVYVESILWIDRVCLNVQRSEYNVEPTLEDIKNIFAKLSSMSEQTRNLGFPITANKFDSLIMLFGEKGNKIDSQFINLYSYCRDRIIHDLDGVILYIPNTDLKLGFGKEFFNISSINYFEGAADDMKDAFKCYTFECYTSAAFHSMRAIEFCIKECAKKVGVNIPKGYTWNDIIEKGFVPYINSLQAQSDQDKKNKLRLSAICAHLHSVRYAWRNETMHCGERYTKSESFDIMNNSRALISNIEDFMRAA